MLKALCTALLFCAGFGASVAGQVYGYGLHVESWPSLVGGFVVGCVLLSLAGSVGS